MTPPSTSAVLPSDVDLVRIAVAPHQRLFPYLNRTSAFAPLILVCCIFPSLQLLTNPALDDLASLWGMRSLAFANGTEFKQFLEPGLNETSLPLNYQPPLAAWLNGVLILILGPAHVWVWSIISLAATGVGIWLLSRVARTIGGVNAALTSAILVCTLPQILRMAISPSNESLGLLFMLASVYYFQTHLEGKLTDISSSLVISGIAWGLSILAIGPVAFLIPLVFVAHAANQGKPFSRNVDRPNLSTRWRRGWPVFSSTLILVGIGLVAGIWWEVMMFVEHGLNFWSSWWCSLPAECLDLRLTDRLPGPCVLMMPSWQLWLDQNIMLIGWLIFGLMRAWKELSQPTSEMVRRRYQLLVIWWSLAFVGRLLFEFVRPGYVANTAIWNVAWLAPTVLLASLGINALIDRSSSQRSEFLLVILLVSLMVYRLTGLWALGVVAGMMVLVLFALAARVIPWLGGIHNIWAETDWRQILQFTIYGSLLTCIAAGIESQNVPFHDEDHLSELRDRLSNMPDVSRISLVAARDPIPASLRFLLRCRWPDVELVTNEGWDSGLTRAMNEEAKNPVSRFLILEWSRRNVHLTVDNFQGWQMKAMGDPMRIHGRRLSLILIEPQS